MGHPSSLTLSSQTIYPSFFDWFWQDGGVSEAISNAKDNCFLKILFRFTNGYGANYWGKMRRYRHRGLGLLQLIPWSALTCGGLHGWAGDGGSILGYSAGVRFRGAGCWWGGWWVHQSPRFPLSKWMGKSLLPIIGNLSSHSPIPSP